MSEFKKDESEIGALWEKSGARGIYMTGTINGMPVVLFKNDRKEPGSKQPDWRVLKSKPKGDLASNVNAAVSRGYNRGDDEAPF